LGQFTDEVTAMRKIGVRATQERRDFRALTHKAPLSKQGLGNVFLLGQKSDQILSPSLPFTVPIASCAAPLAFCISPSASSLGLSVALPMVSFTLPATLLPAPL